MVSTGTVPPPPGQQEPEPLQQQAPPSPLPMEADPSGFTERAPALSSLLPDEALSRALAGGDALAVHAALVARSSRERSGPTRDTLRALLAQPALFAVSEAPPRLGIVLGTGTALVGLPPPEKQTEPFIATRAVRVLGLPVWPLGQHLVRRGRDGQLEVMGRVPTSLGFRALRWLSRVGVGVAALTVVAAALSPFAVRELFIVNGLSRPVVVQVDGKPVPLEPGSMTQRWKLSLGEPYRVSTSWQGDTKPIEELSVEASQRAVYNVLGASSVAVEENPEQKFQSGKPLEGSVASLAGGEALRVSPGGWERRVQELADKGNHREAAALAVAVAMADPLSTRAREEAARYMVRLPPDEAEATALKLYQRYPEDFSVGVLLQDVYVTIDREQEMRRFFKQPRFKEAASVQPALLYARSRPPDEQRAAYAAVLKSFPEAPEALRAVARLRLADGYPKSALELLEAARARAPESVEELELRVRALVSLKQVREASAAVREYAGEHSRRTWELAVLASRMARLAGPTRTQYTVEQLVPASVLHSSEKRVALTLLATQNEVLNTELASITDPPTREALELTRATLTNLDFAVAQANSAQDSILRRLPLEAATVLALESSIRNQPGTERIFRSHFALAHARAPLVDYVHRGELHPRFFLLAPHLQAAAYLVRARAVQDNAFVQRAYARWTDVLGGFARRALDPKYEEPEAREARVQDEPRPTHGRRREIIRIIRPGEQPPEDFGPRVPRPWQ